MDDKVTAFIEANGSAAMVTLRRDGTPHVARVAIGFLDGRLLSSSTAGRVRTRNLRRDPRCTLFVFESPGARYLGLDTRTRIIEGPEVPELTLRFFRQVQSRLPQPPRPGHVLWFGQERTDEEFLRMMVEEGRILYEFEPTRAYGLY